MAEKGVVEEDGRDEEENRGPSKRRWTGSQLCGICRKAAIMQGHVQRLEKQIAQTIPSSFN